MRPVWGEGGASNQSMLSIARDRWDGSFIHRVSMVLNV